MLLHLFLLCFTSYASSAPWPSVKVAEEIDAAERATRVYEVSQKIGNASRGEVYYEVKKLVNGRSVSPTFRAAVIDSVLCIFLPNSDPCFHLGESANVVPESPVVYIHGDAGARLQIKASKDSGYDTKGKWTTVWLALSWIHSILTVMRLHVDPTNSTNLINSPGIEVQMAKYGDPNTAEQLADSYYECLTLPNCLVFEYVGDLLRKQFGYVNGQSLTAAQYDFRQALPHLFDVYIPKLKASIEKSYSTNGNKSVTLFCHSYGTLLAHQLLVAHVKAAWKEKYIRRVILVSPAIGGTSRAVKSIAQGYNLGLPFEKSSYLRELVGSWGSTYQLLPSSELYDENYVLVSTPSRNYTSLDYVDLVQRLGWGNYTKFMKSLEKFYSPTMAPGVEVHCMYGTGLSTVEKVMYAKETDVPLGGQVKYTNDGDGTVLGTTLRVCQSWAAKQTQPVAVYEFKNGNHVKVLKCKSFLARLNSIIGGKKLSGWEENSYRADGFVIYRDSC